MQMPYHTPRNEPFGADGLQRMYRARFGGRQAYRDNVWRVLIRDYFQRWIRPEDVVLDVGAGYGEFINHIRCGKKYALDLNPDTADRVSGGVEVVAQDCSAPWPFPDNHLDVVFTSNFLEHLPDKRALSRTLGEANRCIKPGGRFILMGPNIKYLPGAYWDFIDHHIPLTEQSLAEALVQQGFRIEKCIAKFLPFTMVNGPQYPAFFLAVYLRIPFVWRIFGKQFLVLAKKESL